MMGCTFSGRTGGDTMMCRTVRFIRAASATLGVSIFVGAILIPKYQSNGAGAVGELLLMVAVGCGIGWAIRHLANKR